MSATITEKNTQPTKSVYTPEERSQAAKAGTAARHARFDAMYGAGQCESFLPHADPHWRKDWFFNQDVQNTTSKVDYLQPEYLIRKYGGSMVLRQANILAGQKSLAQDCSVPKRDARGFLIEAVGEKEAA